MSPQSKAASHLGLSKVPNPKLQGGHVAGRIGIWSLGFHGCLELGFWCFPSPCWSLRSICARFEGCSVQLFKILHAHWSGIEARGPLFGCFFRH